jgi:casein kinase 1
MVMDMLGPSLEDLF